MCLRQVNTSAFKEGWMVKLKLSNPAELESLLDAATYAKTIADN
jgi:glycine cleavage system H protein